MQFKIKRFNPETDQRPYFASFEVEIQKNLSVLEGLFYILENLDGSLSFRYSCRGAVCGSCAMLINGKIRLACQVLVKTLHSEVITVEPLPHLTVLKDLVVDLTPFFEKYQLIKPFLISNTLPPAKERSQSPSQRQKIDEMIKCILCGCCYSACPLVYNNRDFLGPAALTKAYRFLADSRDTAKKERIDLIAQENGIYRCHTAFACSEVCPKEIAPTYSIQKLKGAAVQKELKLL